MAKQTEQNDGLMKSGTSKRSRSGRSGGGSRVPRVMILGLLVVVAGGAALFWPRGGSVPTGIGENQTVVAVPGTGGANGSVPRSGDVDINAEATPQLTPEASEGETAKTPPANTVIPAGKTAEPAVQNTTPKTEPAPAAKTAPKQAPPSATKPAETSEPRVMPRKSGPYVVQVGSFGLAENADKEAARLKARGWEARVQAGNNSNGEMVFRVWIVSFANRQEAQTFINQNSQYLAGAIPVHR